MIDYSRYLLGLFSHRRGDELWKGMLQVDLSDAQGDVEALVELERLEQAAADAAAAAMPGGEGAAAPEQGLAGAGIAEGGAI